MGIGNTISDLHSPNDQTLPTPSLSRNIFLKGGNPMCHGFHQWNLGRAFGCVVTVSARGSKSRQFDTRLRQLFD